MRAAHTLHPPGWKCMARLGIGLDPALPLRLTTQGIAQHAIDKVAQAGHRHRGSAARPGRRRCAPAPGAASGAAGRAAAAHGSPPAAGYAGGERGSRRRAHSRAGWTRPGRAPRRACPPATRDARPACARRPRSGWPHRSRRRPARSPVRARSRGCRRAVPGRAVARNACRARGKATSRRAAGRTVGLLGELESRSRRLR